MAIADLSNVLNIFRGKEPTDSEREALYKEVMLMTLARASSADAAIDPVEISTVQKILKRETGESFSDADIRLASRPALYQEAPFSKYLASVRKKLDSSNRSAIVCALADVIRSDTQLSALELDFFNMVAEALQATPAEIAGLVR
ncbi:MAG: TerB family tellurite resistance protein [Gammaproteobacteria bacterium]|nr:TerB family tellurite resistance protein [Gammaproteobacteria bacterium]MDH4254674.1 TerB family tellurite resistance protein [Gammaproteobacteria bacterium]MDH5310028.1 TerB family tellurite resistance protein [Gammaproteobacteria bacterium]